MRNKFFKIYLISAIFFFLISFNSCTKDENKVTVLCLVCDGGGLNASEFNGYCEGVSAESILEEGVQVRLTKELLEQYKTLLEVGGATCTIS